MIIMLCDKGVSTFCVSNMRFYFMLVNKKNALSCMELIRLFQWGSKSPLINMMNVSETYKESCCYYCFHLNSLKYLKLLVLPATEANGKFPLVSFWRNLSSNVNHTSSKTVFSREDGWRWFRCACERFSICIEIGEKRSYGIPSQRKSCFWYATIRLWKNVLSIWFGEKQLFQLTKCIIFPLKNK